MKKFLILFLISFACLFLDSTVMPFIGIYGYYPSITVCFIICYSVVNGGWEGIWIGVGCGIIQDIFFINIFGINAISNMIICVLAGVVGSNIFKEKMLIPVIAVFLLTLFRGAIIVGILFAAKIYANNMAIIYVAIYNMIISLFIYKAVYRLCQKEYMQIRWRF